MKTRFAPPLAVPVGSMPPIAAVAAIGALS